VAVMVAVAGLVVVGVDAAWLEQATRATPETPENTSGPHGLRRRAIDTAEVSQVSALDVRVPAHRRGDVSRSLGALGYASDRGRGDHVELGSHPFVWFHRTGLLLCTEEELQSLGIGWRFVDRHGIRQHPYSVPDDRSQSG